MDLAFYCNKTRALRSHNKRSIFVKRIPLMILIFSLLTTGIQAQNEPVFNIKSPGDDKARRCQDYFEVMRSIPAEVRFTIIERNRNLYLVFNSRPHFESIFDHKGDGFAIDIIHKDQYRCDGPNQHAKSWAHKGTLLPPMYKDRFMPLIQESANGIMVIKYGQLPETFDPKEVEYNLLIVQKNWLCENRYFYNLDYDTWSLLPMGLYRDSIQNPGALPYRNLQKTMNFKVPFEKDKTVFQEADVQPIRDSLNLTDYVIKTIDLKAFSSVEGPLERNIRLQEGRAQSIIDILKGYQNESIQSTISTSENWEQFRVDLQGTRFVQLLDMSEVEVKAALSAGKPLLRELESILSKHRKAEINISLEKRVNPVTGSPELLKSLFSQSIEEKEIDQALYLQTLAFERIKNNTLPESFLGELKIPESAVYGSLLSNRAIFQAEHAPDNLKQSAEAFQNLLRLLPNNKNIRYNLAVMRLKQWAVNEQEVNRRDLQQLVSLVERAGLPRALVRNLRVNYHIILTKYLNDEGDFSAKNRSLRYIFNEYRNSNLEDDELLRVAKFMTHYSRFDWAQALLKPRVLTEDVSTDVIFYYLNLTIADNRNTRKPDYQKVLDKARKKDQTRFCSLFKPKPQGGITFQLLDDKVLKRKFCETCAAPASGGLEAKHSGN